MTQFKKLNEFEKIGLTTLLEKAYPWLGKQTVGIESNNLIAIQNTITEHQPTDRFCMLGAFGLTPTEDVILEYWDYAEVENRFYRLKFRDLKDWDETQPFRTFENLLEFYNS